MRALQHMSAAECAMHFFRQGLPPGKTLNHVHHMGIRDIVSANHRFTFGVDSARLVPIDKISYRKDLTEKNRR